MVRELFPDGDREFADAAKVFASAIEHDPERFNLSTDDAQLISAFVQRYRDALAKALRRDTRTQRAIREKDKARAEAEQIIRKYANIIRADDWIEPAVKESIFVKERPKRLRKRRCPQQRPHVRFVRSEDGVHVLEFREAWGARSRAKPRGAARLEVYVDLVPAGAQPPKEPGLPGERAVSASGGPWYLRSFTTNPIRVKHPLPGAPDEPRLVVYWARWADATGEVGPWSHAVTARVEGWGAARGSAAPGSSCVASDKRNDDGSPQMKLAA